MSIYLHFLDRELASSVNAKVTRSSIKEAITTILVCAIEPIYCGLSLIYETGTIDNDVYKLLLSLIQNSQLLPISSHPTISEFFESRRIIYSHDKERYPSYFNEEQSDKLCNENVSILHKKVSTTSALRKNLIAILSEKDSLEYSIHQNAFINHDTIRKTIENGITNIKNKAITFSAFATYFPSDGKKADEYFIRRLISDNYSSHYINFLKTSIMTGIPEFSYYDFLAVDFPFFDYVLLSFFKKNVFKFLQNCNDKNLIEQIISTRGSVEHLYFVETVRKYIKVLAYNYNSDKLSYNNFISIRSHILEFFITNLSNLKLSFSPNNVRDLYKNYSQSLENKFNTLCKSNGKFKQAFDNVIILENNRMTRILICTAVDIESKTLYELAHSKGLSPNVKNFKSFSAINFGPVNDCEIFSCQSQKGSIGSGGSCLTTYDAIDEIKPNYVLSLGIAFGADKKSKKLAIF